jgi:hypothetical protein
MKYRIYPDGEVVHEDDFADKATSFDHYQEVNVPDALEDYFCEVYTTGR